jgi:hypothetical protein
LVAGAANISLATLDTSVAAQIGAGGGTNVTGDVKVEAVAVDLANGRGFNLVAGGLAMGTVFSTATLTPSVRASIGDNATVTGGTITVNATHNDSNGTATAVSTTADGKL